MVQDMDFSHPYLLMVIIIVNQVREKIVLITLFISMTSYGMESSVKVQAVLAPNLLHGSVCDFLLPLMTALKCAFVVIKAQKMKTLQLNCLSSMCSS